MSDAINWDAIRQRYIEAFPHISVQAVADEFGVDYREVQRRATLDEWTKKRKAFKKTGANAIVLCDNSDIETTRKILSAELDTVRKEEWASWDRRHLTLAKTASQQVKAAYAEIATSGLSPLAKAKTLQILTQTAKTIADLERAVHGRENYDRAAAQFINQVNVVNPPRTEELPDDDAEIRRQARASIPAEPLDAQYTVIEDAAVE